MIEPIRYGEYLKFKRKKKIKKDFARLVYLIIFFLILICGLNMWLFYKG